MGIFGGKKQAPAAKPPGWETPFYSGKESRSREYKLFMEQEATKRSWYESLVGLASGVLHVKADEGTKKSVESAVNFTGMKITPEGVMSLFVMTIISFAAIGILIIFSGLLPTLGGVAVIAAGGAVA